MKKTRLLAMLLALVLMCSVFAACGGGSGPAATEAPASEPAASGHDLAIGTTGSHLYMYTCGSSESDNFCRRLVYDQLFYIDDFTGEVSSDILASYSWTDDVTLHIELKDGITFSDGTPMTAEDVLFTLQTYVNNSNSEMDWYDMIDYDKSTVDGLSADIVYKETYGPAISTLCSPILSKAFIEAHPDGDDAWWYNPIGSGPYKVEEVQMGVSVKFVKRDDYWNKDARFEADSITIKYYSDTTAEYSDFNSGVIDVMLDITSTQVEQVQSLANAEVVIQSADDVCMVCFNEATVPKEVREAIAYALDINVISDAVLGIFGTPAQSTLAQTMAEFSPGHSYPYDPDHARQVLADAGYSAGEIVLDMVGSSAADQTTLGEMVQAMLGDVGITVNVGTYDFATMLPMLLQGQTDLQRMTTSDGTPQREPLETYSSFVANGTFPAASIPDEAINEALDRGYSTVDPEGRKEAYIEAQQLIFDTFRAIPLYEWNSGYAYNTAKISQIDLTSVQRIDLRFIYLNE